MRIAVNTRFLLPDKLEGLGWYTQELLRRMVLQHPEDEFIFCFDRPFDSDFIYGPNVEPIVIFPPARHPVLWYAWFEWALPAALRRCKADVFFSPDSYLSLRSPVPTLMTVHDLIPLQHPEQVPWWSRDYYRYFFPKYMRRAEHIVAVSEFTKNCILETTGLSSDKISVVYNGSRAGFQPLDNQRKGEIRAVFSGGKDYFFYSGAIHPRKNIPRLIRAFDTFKSRTAAPVKLLLAGRFAWQTGAVKTSWEQAKNKNDIRFLGYVQEVELQQLTAAALALVNISLSEGFGLPILEAMHCDTPVVCSNTTALREVAGPAGLLVNPSSESEIADALQKIYTDGNMRKSLIENGKQQRLKFDWDSAAEQVYKLISTVAQR